MQSAIELAKITIQLLILFMGGGTMPENCVTHQSTRIAVQCQVGQGSELTVNILAPTFETLPDGTTLITDRAEFYIGDYFAGDVVVETTGQGSSWIVNIADIDNEILGPGDEGIPNIKLIWQWYNPA